MDTKEKACYSFTPFVLIKKVLEYTHLHMKTNFLFKVSTEVKLSRDKQIILNKFFLPDLKSIFKTLYLWKTSQIEARVPRGMMLTDIGDFHNAPLAPPAGPIIPFPADYLLDVLGIYLLKTFTFPRQCILAILSDV